LKRLFRIRWRKKFNNKCRKMQKINKKNPRLRIPHSSLKKMLLPSTLNQKRPKSHSKKSKLILMQI